MRRRERQSMVVRDTDDVAVSAVTAEPMPLDLARVIALQRSVGNVAVGRLLRSHQGSPMPGLAQTNAPLLDDEGEDEVEPIQPAAPQQPPAREDKAPAGPLAGPTLGFEFQSFWTLRKGNNFDPVVSKSEKLVVDKIERESGGQPLMLWYISPDAPNSPPGKEGEQLHTAFKVLEFVTNVLRPDEFNLARARMQLFIDILRSQLQGKPSVAFSDVWQAWSTQVKTLGTMSAVCSDLSIGHEQTEQGAAPWSKADQAKVTPQMTFDISLAEIPRVFSQLIDRGVGDASIHGRLQIVLGKCITEAAKAKLSDNVHGLATLLLWEMRTPKLLNKNPLGQQKPYHLFMLRRSFHALYTSLSPSEKTEWAKFAATVTSTAEVYPADAFMGSATVTKSNLAKTVAEPLSVLSRDDRKAIITAIRGVPLSAPPSTPQGQLLIQKMNSHGNPLTGLTDPDLRAALDEIAGLLPPEQSAVITAIKDRDLMSRATGEALGKWPARQNTPIVATFEWRAMRQGWKDIDAWLADAEKTYAEVKGLGAV